ncbi:hypothetical protein ASA1KI_09200 [Opitutales bacterium ASA1]|uniref:carboxypeptidase regulatory-like domain-containing protein n=1 Tax=Congregicoccus parvus TaxID=3081749 RepID=UPI002B31A98A|nr:hypothetical protein ASA1KI_09200 [Opitutales bacterium ASA1]
MKRGFESIHLVVAGVFIVVAAVVGGLALRHVVPPLGTPGRNGETADGVPGYAAIVSDEESSVAGHDVVPIEPEVRFDVLRDFDRWTTRYLCTVEPQAREALVAEGISLAAARRRALHTWAATDPERVLRAAVPPDVRRGLPKQVDSLLETPIDGLGEWRVVAALPPGDETPADFRPTRREAVVGGRVYEAFTTEALFAMPSRASTLLRGLAVDDRLVLGEAGARVLDRDETPLGRTRIEEVAYPAGRDAHANLSPTSHVWIDVGSRVFPVCCSTHAETLVGSPEVAASGGDGTSGGKAARVAGAPFVGVKRVVVIRIRFADQSPAWSPQSDVAAAAMVEEANGFFLENSGGLFGIEGTITPVYTLPQTAKWYVDNDTSGFARNVLEAAVRVAADPAAHAGNSGLPAYDAKQFDYEVVRYDGGPGNFQGQGYVGVRGAWMKTDSAGVLAHELAHNLGLWHANAWSPNEPATIVGPGRNVDYGDVFDTMGRNSGAHWHLNAWEKHALGWIDTDAIVTVGMGRTIETIAAHDLGTAAAGGEVRALRFVGEDGRELWAEVRRHPDWSGNRWLGNGLSLRWAPWSGSGGGTQLLDANPDTAEGFTDSPLTNGRSFSDTGRDVHLTPLEVAGVGSGSMRVAVTRGASIGNTPPNVRLETSASGAAPGDAIVFRAVADDAEGDALSYAWEFSDRSIQPDAAEVSRSFSTLGHQVVRVVVSDRRGGVASASSVVLVGQSTGDLVRGHVVDSSGAGIADVRIHNGRPATALDLRQARTDTQGWFALADLASAPSTLVAQKTGWVIVPKNFRNPIEAPVGERELEFVGEHIGYAVSGHVRGAGGEPVARALVRVAGRVERTDDSGGFRFEGMAPGSHTLTAEKGGRAFEAVSLNLGYGDVADVVVTERTFRLSGEIVGVDPSTAVTITDGLRATTAVVVDTVDGPRLRFELSGVRGGRRNLAAIGAQHAFAPVGIPLPLLVEGDVDGIVFRAEARPTRFVTGRVTGDGEGIAGVRVSDGFGSVDTDEDGRYFLTGAESGTVVVSVSTPAGFVLPSERHVDLRHGSVGDVDFVVTRHDDPPWFVRGPRLDSDATGPFLRLSAEADDDGGAESLRYSWSLESGPDGAEFLRAPSRGAMETVLRVRSVGVYRVRVAVEDAFGGEASETIDLEVVPRAVALSIVAPSRGVVLGEDAVFALQGTDQFGDPMSVPPSAAEWSASDGASVSPHGVVRAGAAGGPFRIEASMEDLRASATFTVGYPSGPGEGIVQEVWTGIPGWSVAHLLASPRFPNQPNYVGVLRGGLETVSGAEHDYGQRLRGYFVPPVDGDYVFHIASNNASELWLSSDAKPENKVQAARVATSTGQRSWFATTAQSSMPVTLRADRPVYLEVLHKEDSADDHLAVAVTLPGGVFEGPVPAHRLLPWGEAAYPGPSVVSAATATPSVVGRGLECELRVVARSAGGATALTYRWEVVGESPGPVVFLPNGSETADTASARFRRPGEYLLRVVVADAAGQTAESSVRVRVAETSATWRLRHFTAAELDAPGAEERLWGAGADPDGDGVVNLLEYAFGMDPLVPGRARLPVVETTTVDGVEYLSVRFVRNAEASDLEYRPQASSDLRDWSGDLVLVSVDPVTGEELHRDRRPASEFQRRFLRVNVTSP